MSDLAATNCGCERDNNCRNDCGCFGNNFIWLIILFACCGNNSWGGCGNGCGCGNDNCCLIIILLLLCGNKWGGNGCGICG